MSLSATSVAFILTIASSAHGSPVVIGEVREDVPAAQTPASTEAQPAVAPATTPDVTAPEVTAPEVTAPEVTAPEVEAATPLSPEDEELYSRFFGGEAEEAEAEPEAPVVEAARDSAWPWWVWPVGIMSVGVLFFMRGKAREKLLPTHGIRIVSRSALGKEGTLAMIEVADGDHRTRRLLVGFGGGAPRLVADVSAWDVAVAAPAPESAAAPHHTGPDPLQAVPVQVEQAAVPASFGGTLKTAAARYEASTAPVLNTDTQEAATHDELVADVLAMRDTKELTKSVSTQRHPAYSRRQVVA
jgi:hypothetical protein